MLWFLFYFLNGLFGSSLLLLFKNDGWQLTILFCAGMVIGPILTGYLIFWLTIFMPFNKSFVIFLGLFEILISLIILFYISQKKRNLSITLEKSPHFFILIFIIGLIAKCYLKYIYHDLSKPIPSFALPVLNHESSFISSIQRGANIQRSGFFFYDDPCYYGFFFSQPSSPLLFLTACSFLGGSYENISYFATFINIISTVAFFFLLAHLYSHNNIFITFLFLFSSPWTLIPKASQNEQYIYQTRNPFLPTHCPIFGYFLSLSKNSSFSIPLTIFIFSSFSYTGFSSTYLSFIGFLVTLIPSYSLSFGTFIVMLCRMYSIKSTFSSILLLFPRLILARPNVKPIWFEYSLQYVDGDHIISIISFFVIGLGPAFLSLISLFYTSFKKRFRLDFDLWHCLIIHLTAFIGVSIIRFNSDINDMALGSMIILMPVLSIYVVELFSHFAKKLKQYSAYSSIIGLFISMWAFCIFGGIFALKFNVIKTVNGLSVEGVLMGKFINNITEPNHCIISPLLDGLNPASSYAGRQILISDIEYGYQIGHTNPKSLAIKFFRQMTNDNDFSFIDKTNCQFYLTNVHSTLQPTKYFSKIIYQNNEWILFKNNRTNPKSYVKTISNSFQRSKLSHFFAQL